ncbi:MAG: OmpH family outer membrane protein, partial [Phycisphaerae bacterium]
TRDVEKILSERARQLQDKLDAHRRAIETRRSELAKLDPDSAEAYKLQQEIVRLQVQAEMLQKIDQSELLRERNLWTSQGYKQAFAAVRQIAQSRGLDLVLFQDRFDPDTPPAAILARMPARKVVYADPRLDITEDVLKLLNQQYQQRGGSASIKIGL